MTRKNFNKKIEAQSREYADTHDMLLEALEGQVYLKETFHKVNTNQVTGEALKKVSVGGKGGFGSQGDARDQEKQVEVTSRVMVLSDPSQRTFDHNVALHKLAVDFNSNSGEGVMNTTRIKKTNLSGEEVDYDVEFERHKESVEYIYQGESYTKRVWCPSHIFGEKKVKGWIELTKRLGRDYDEFAHSNSLDPSDAHRMIEYYYKGNFLVDGVDIDIERARDLYDELCGYKGAWKYVGIDGAEHRRYRFTVGNLLNQKEYKKKKEVYKPRGGYMNWEASSYNHNTTVYEIYTKYYNETKSEEWLDDQMRGLDRKDCTQFINWQLGEPKPWDWREEKVPPAKAFKEPSKEYLAIKEAADSLERKRRLESSLKAPELNDWKIVYKWELTKQGKVMFANEKL